METIRRGILVGRRFTGLLVMSSLLSAVVGGCGSGQEAALARETQSVPATVLSSEGGQGLEAMFPLTAGIRQCVIPGGGPSPGIRVPGRCQTSFEDLAGGGQRIRFTESWRGSDFRGQGAQGMTLSYSWTFTLSASGKVVSLRTQGDFPPQMVK